MATTTFNFISINGEATKFVANPNNYSIRYWVEGRLEASHQLSSEEEYSQALIALASH